MSTTARREPWLCWRPEYGMEVSGDGRSYISKPVWEVLRAGGFSYSTIAVALLHENEQITPTRAAEIHALYAARTR